MELFTSLLPKTTHFKVHLLKESVVKEFFFPPPSSGSLTSLFWDRPDKVGSPSKFANGTEFRRGPGSGTSGFLTHQRLRSRDFIKGDDVYILSTIEGMWASTVFIILHYFMMQ